MKEKHAKDGKSAAAASDAALASAHDRAENRGAYDRRADDGLTPIESLMMRREVRIGVSAIAVLVLIFGYVFVRKINENAPASTPVADAASSAEPAADDADTSNPPPTVVNADANYQPPAAAPSTAPGHVGPYAPDAPRDDLAPPNKSYLPPRRPIDDAASHAAAPESSSTAASKYGAYLQDDQPRADLADRSDPVGTPPDSPDAAAADGPDPVASANEGSRYAIDTSEADSLIVEATPIVDPTPEPETAATADSPTVVAQQSPTAEPRNRTYVTASGDTPASIAERLYGDNRYAAALMAYNGVEIAPDVTVNAGGEVLVPHVSDLERSFGRLIPSDSPRSVARDVASTEVGGATNESAVQDASSAAGAHRDDAVAREHKVATRVYQVAQGETVYDIARKQLGGVSRWREILRLNDDQLRGDIDAVAPGMRLRLPDEGRSEVARQRGELLWR